MEQIGVLSDDWYAQFADALEAVYQLEYKPRGFQAKLQGPDGVIFGTIDV